MRPSYRIVSYRIEKKTLISYRVEKKLIAHLCPQVNKLDKVWIYVLVSQSNHLFLTKAQVYIIRTPAIVSRMIHFNQTMPTIVLCCYLALVERLLDQWGILKHFPQSRCIFISHRSREKKQSFILIWIKGAIWFDWSGLFSSVFGENCWCPCQ